MKQVIRKASVDVIHIHQDNSLWTVIQSFPRNKYPLFYTLIQEYSEIGITNPPTRVSRDTLQQIFDYDVVSLFDNNIPEPPPPPPVRVWKEGEQPRNMVKWNRKLKRWE